MPIRACEIPSFHMQVWRDSSLSSPDRLPAALAWPSHVPSLRHCIFLFSVSSFIHSHASFWLSSYLLTLVLSFVLHLSLSLALSLSRSLSRLLYLSVSLPLSFSLFLSLALSYSASIQSLIIIKLLRAQKQASLSKLQPRKPAHTHTHSQAQNKVLWNAVVLSVRPCKPPTHHINVKTMYLHICQTELAT